MSADHPLTARVISMTPDEALEKAMQGDNPDAGLVVAVMYQAVTRALDDILDEYEHEPDVAVAKIRELLYHLTPDEKPTLN